MNTTSGAWAYPFTVEQLAHMLGCSVYTVRVRARDGDLPGLKFGDDWVFPPDALTSRLTEMALDEAKLRRIVPAPKAIAFGARTRGQRAELPLSLQSPVAPAQ